MVDSISSAGSASLLNTLKIDNLATGPLVYIFFLGDLLSALRSCVARKEGQREGT